MYSSLSIVTPPQVEPVSLALARSHLRVDATYDDTLIQLYLQAAREHVEQYLNRSLITQTLCWTVAESRERLPTSLAGVNHIAIIPPLWAQNAWATLRHRRVLEIPRAPVQSIGSVVIAKDGVSVTLDPSTYVLDPTVPAMLRFHHEAQADGCDADRHVMQVTFTVGYGPNQRERAGEHHQLDPTAHRQPLRGPRRHRELGDQPDRSSPPRATPHHLLPDELTDAMADFPSDDYPIGRLRWTVTLATRTQTPDSGTSIIDTYQAIALVRADVQPVSDMTFYASASTTEDTTTPITHRIIIRYQDYLDQGTVVLRTTTIPSTGVPRVELFRVRRVKERGGRKRFTELLCELERVDEGTPGVTVLPANPPPA